MANVKGKGESWTAIGLMSGTSMDGLDGIVSAFDLKNNQVVDVAEVYRPYSPEFQKMLREARSAFKKAKGNAEKAIKFFDENADGYTFTDLAFQFHMAQVEVVEELLEKSGLSSEQIDVIGMHGQTLEHLPGQKVTVQLGDGQALADATDIQVVYDFRSHDVLAGGQGAPLKPYHHRFLLKGADVWPAAFVNCGGTANVTIMTEKEDGTPILLAYDSGPGASMVNQYIQSKTGETMDLDGQYGLQGTVSFPVVEALQAKAVKAEDGGNYLTQKPPKSTDGNQYELIPELDQLDFNDAVATLEYFTALTIVKSLRLIPSDIPLPKKWVLGGGGWQNPVILKQFKNLLKVELRKVDVQLADELGLNSNMIEAQGFAHIAIRRLLEEPVVEPLTTGCEKPMICGVIAQPGDDVTDRYDRRLSMATGGNQKRSKVA